MTELRSVEVALALIWRAGTLLITQRPAGTHLAGSWEFPGGKLEPGETPELAAEREALEEVGVVVQAIQCRSRIAHDYAERRVLLYPVDCAWQSGEATCRGVAAALWIEPARLHEFSFPAANQGLLRELGAGLTNPVGRPFPG